MLRPSWLIIKQLPLAERDGYKESKVHKQLVVHILFYYWKFLDSDPAGSKYVGD